MHLLWVKVGGLWPLDTGGRLRSFHLIRELSRRHQVTVLTTHGPADDPAGLARALGACAEVTSLPHALPKWTSARFAFALARSWISPLPVELWKCRVPALGGEVERRLARGDVDLCIADFLAATPNVPLGGPVPVMLFEHNVEHRIWQRLASHDSRPWRRAALAVEWRKMRWAEARACREARVTLAVSETDAAALRAIAPAATVRPIPTGVDVGYFAPQGPPVREPALVFTGSLDWYPNEDAILYFIDAILPAIRAAVPDVTLTIVGRNPSWRLRSRAAACGADVTGTVADVRPHVARAAVAIVPLRIGGGTRLKIFEAMAMGLPVVSTTIGAEGLPVVPGRHLLQADDPAAFARAVVTLLRHPARREALGRAARELVVSRFAWPQVADEVDRICREAATPLNQPSFPSMEPDHLPSVGEGRPPSVEQGYLSSVEQGFSPARTDLPRRLTCK